MTRFQEDRLFRFPAAPCSPDCLVFVAMQRTRSSSWTWVRDPDFKVEIHSPRLLCLLCWFVAGVGASLIPYTRMAQYVPNSFLFPMLLTNCFKLNAQLFAIMENNSNNNKKEHIALKVLWDHMVYVGSVCCLPLSVTCSAQHLFPVSHCLSFLILV